MTNILDGFDELSDQLESERGQRLRATQLSNGALTPERAARANTLSDQQGQPFGVVAANLDGYEADQRLADVSAVGQRVPPVGEFLSDPRRMALAGDDAEGLAKFATAYGDMAFGATPTFGQRDDGPQMRATEPGYLQELIGALVAGQRRGVSYLPELPDLRSERSRATEDAVARGLGFGSAAEHDAARAGAYLGDVERRAQGAEVMSEATRQDFLRLAQANETDSLLEAISLVARSPRAIGTTVTGSLGMGAPGLALTAATGGMGRLATAGAAGGGSGVTEYGASMSEAMADAGVDTTDAYQVAAFLRDPEKVAAARERALTRGVAVGAFDALTAGLAGIFITNARRGVRSAAWRTAAEGGMQMAGGMAGEATAQAAVGDELRLGDIVVEGLAELPSGAVETWSNYQTARNAGRVRWINERMGQVMSAADDHARLAAATDAAAAMKLGERSPDDVAAFVAQLGGAEQVVYLPADAARTLFQSDSELLNLVGSATDLAEQMARGELAIPMPQWMAVVPRLENREEILRHARTKVDGLSVAELEETDLEALAQEFGATDEAAERAQPGEGDPRQRIVDDVMGQLIATDRYTPAAAEAQARLWGAAFSRFGAMIGQDPFALYERYMGGVRGPADPRAVRPFSGSARMDALLDSIRTPTEPSPKELFGPSLSSWLVAQGGIRDEGGELRAKDAGRIRPGLVNSQGLPMDRAREIAAEAGYMGADTDLNDFLNLLDADLRGSPVYSDQEGDSARQEFQAERQALLDAIEDVPALRDMSAADFAALTNQQILDMLAPDETLEQPAFHGTPHDVDRFSLQKIGSGEGAQVYGWGLYFASQRDVADFYRRNLTGIARNIPATIADKALQDAGGDRGRAIATLTRRRDALPDAARGNTQAAIEWLRRGQDTGRLYQVEVPDSDVLLDWDANLDDQPEAVQQALQALPWYENALEQIEDSAGIGSNATGRDLYRWLTEDYTPEEASKLLQQAGIPGLRYLDGGSRGQGEGSHNYVIWDEAAISDPMELIGAAIRESRVEAQRAGDIYTGDLFGNAVPEADRLQPTGDAGMNAEHRPDYTEAVGQAGANAVDELIRQYGGTLIGDAIARDFIDNGTAQLAGRKITSPGDLAAMASVYRNPAYETLRYVFTDDDGNVLGESAISSRLPSESAVFPEGNSLQWVRERGMEFGATQVWMIHNHPSGNPTPSAADRNFTRSLAEALKNSGPKMAGHVVLNHEIYSSIDAAGGVSDDSARIPGFTGSQDPLLQVPSSTSLGDLQATFGGIGSGQVAAFASELYGKAEADSIGIIVADAKGAVTICATFPKSVLDAGDKRAAAALARVAHGSRGVFVFVVGDVKLATDAKSRRALTAMGRSGLVTDFIGIAPGGRTVSAVGGGWGVPGVTGRSFGTPSMQARSDRGSQVYEGGQDQTETPEFKAWFGDSKVVDADGKPLVVYHGSDAVRSEFKKGFGDDRGENLFPQGFFFSQDRALAESYGEHVTEAYLSIRNPYTARTTEEFARLEVDDAEAMLAGEGYDGAILYLHPEGPPEFVAFRPEQIKSATANRGTFDPNDPSILNQSAVSRLPSGAEVVATLKAHPFVKLKGKPQRVFVVGSAATGKQRTDSDIDVVIEVKSGAEELQRQYRQRAADYFMRNGLTGVHDDVHPQWNGRRVDVYFTENAEADADGRPMVEVTDGVPTTRNQSNADRDLVATHNLSAENLMHAIRVGGLAVPSLAISKGDDSLTGFGDITLIGSRDIVDPKKGAKAYGADIYSPRYPEISYKLDKHSLGLLNKVLSDYRDGREIYSGEITSLRDLTQNGAFRAYAKDRVSSTTNGNEMDALAAKMLQDVGADERIFQGFTYSGNRRYVAHTMENVIKILKKELRGGEGGNYGTGSLRAKFTPQFRSIEAIKKAKGKLKKKEEFEKAKNDVEGELFAIANELAPFYAYDASRFGFTDTVLSVIGDAAKTGLPRAFREYGFSDVPAELQQRIGNYMATLREMPTEYFEVKQLRPVGIDEFSAAVVPSGTSEEVISALRERGLQVVEYDGSEESRRAAVQQVAERESLLFQNASDDAQSPRGQIEIFPDRRMAISLFAKADRSTFLHESGHFFLEVFSDIAAMPDAPQQVKDDFAALLSWFGVESADQIGVDQHEQFARGFEHYLAEGRAPSPELQTVFAQFKAWLLGVYRTLRNLNVELTDDVRGVMDRMLATEDEIAAAQGRAGYEPLPQDVFEASALGRDDLTFADYIERVAAAAEEAKADVLAQLVRAQDRETRAWWKEERAKVQAEVEAEYEATPTYRAARVLSGAQTFADGTPIPEGMRIKLSKASLLGVYEQAYLRRLRGLYVVEGGLPQDDAAMVLGFASGDDLVKALANRGDMKARVEAETDARMRARHGDPFTDGRTPELAMDAIHGRRRMELLDREIEVLARRAGQPVPLRRAITAVAKELIGRKTPRQIRPAEYLTAERRAARESAAAAARGDYAAALDAKRQQAFNAAMYAEGRAAQQEFDRASRYLRRMSDNKARARLGKAGESYLDQVDQLLEQVELRPVSAQQVRRRARLADWVAEQEAAGNPVNVPQRLLDEAGLTNIRDMPLADLRAVVDTIRQIEHLAKLKNKLLLAGQELDAEAVDAELAGSVLGSYATRPERTGDESRGETVARKTQELDLQRVLPTNIARELDGYEVGGPVWRHVIQPIRDAIYGRVMPATKAMQDELAGLMRKHYSEAELKELDVPVWRDAVGDMWSRGRILSLAMNWGSAGNREAILSQARSKLTPEQAGGLLATLDARDFAFAQDVVDQINAYWPQIAEAQRRRTGLVPEKVQPAPYPITTADGQDIEFRGGYYPLKYDPERSGYGATLQEMDDAYNDLRVGKTARAATRNGHTKERVGSGGKTVLLGMDVASSHMRDVIRDLHLGDAVTYVHKVLHGKQFADAVTATGKREYLKALDLWLKDVAAGEMGARSMLEAAAAFIRQNLTAAVLTYKASTALLQVTGLFQTGAVLGRRQTVKGLGKLLAKSWIGPHSIWNDIRAQSPFMAERFGQVPDAVMKVANARAGKLSAGWASMVRWGYVPMGRMQMIADAATWLAARDKALRENGGDAAAAVAYADDAVIRLQAPDAFIEKSAVQRGTLNEKVRQTELVKATAMLLSYMIAKGNVQREMFQRAGGNTGSFVRNLRGIAVSPRAAMGFGVGMIQLFLLETLFMDLLSNGLPDDDDEDGWVLDDWAVYIAGELALGTASTIPAVSQLATAGRGYDAQGPMEKAWSGAARSITTLADNWGDDEEVGREDARAIVNLAGVGFGFPSSAANTTGDAMWRVYDGEDVSPMDFVIRPQKPRDE